jgi:hypothetical protein
MEKVAASAWRGRSHAGGSSSSIRAELARGGTNSPSYSRPSTGRDFPWASITCCDENVSQSRAASVSSSKPITTQ